MTLGPATDGCESLSSFGMDVHERPEIEHLELPSADVFGRSSDSASVDEKAVNTSFAFPSRRQEDVSPAPVSVQRVLVQDPYLESASRSFLSEKLRYDFLLIFIFYSETEWICLTGIIWTSWVH